MADINSTQNGPFHLTSTWAGGAVPTGSQSCNISHVVTLEQDLDEVGIDIQMGAGTLDTQNAAGTTDYDMTIKRVLMWYDTSIVKFRSGTHHLINSGSNGIHHVNDGNIVSMDGCTINCTCSSVYC